mmetsp:Transcript_31521/g.103007  ORF Transcript_31521/g.103007 Transcript_31521/m.103007 type:complete len:219 (-) Transcript_31521:705-1361(-)
MHSDSERVRLRSLAVRPAAAGRGGRRPPLPLGRLGEAAARGGALDVGRLRKPRARRDELLQPLVLVLVGRLAARLGALAALLLARLLLPLLARRRRLVAVGSVAGVPALGLLAARLRRELLVDEHRQAGEVQVGGILRRLEQHRHLPLEQLWRRGGGGGLPFRLLWSAGPVLQQLPREAVAQLLQLPPAGALRAALLLAAGHVCADLALCRVRLHPLE